MYYLLSVNRALEQRLFEAALDIPTRSPLLHLYEEFEFSASFIQELNHTQLRDSIQRIAEFATSRNLRFGRLFEWLVFALFEAHPDWEVVQRNLQIGHPKTIGELDLILRRGEGTYFQLEITNKYYVAFLTSEGWTLSGPNVDDKLADKFEQLSRPFALGKDYLERNGWHPYVQKLLSRGLVWWPKDQFEIMNELHPLHEKGMWVFRSEVDHAWDSLMCLPHQSKWDWILKVDTPMTFKDWFRRQENQTGWLSCELLRDEGDKIKLLILPDHWIR